MGTLTNIFNTIIAMLFFVVSFFNGGITAAEIPSNPAQYDDTVMFISDYQGADRAANLKAILNSVGEEMPGLIVGGGDYQSAFAGAPGSAFGIYEIRRAVAEKWDYDMQYLFLQGNHDAPKSKCINDTGLYEFDKFVVYIINEDDYPWQEGTDIGSAKENTVKASAQKLSDALAQLEEAGDLRPVYVVSHLPLHYSERDGGGDNLYAGYIIDVLNAHGESLNIVYLYGHNHSGTYDDYIGGAVNYLAKGSSIMVGGSNEAKTLSFTYTNCGYVGYSDNSVNDTSTNALTATFITASSEGLNIRKYSKDGLIMQADVAFGAASSLLAPAA